MRKLGLPEVKQFAQTSRNASGILIRSKQMLFFLSSLFGLLRQVFLHFFPWKIMEWPPRMEQEWAVETASTLASDCWMTLLLPQSHDSHLLTELFWAHCPKGQKTQIISERFILSNSHKKKKKIFKIQFMRSLGMATYSRNSCLENPMDRGVWKATVHGVTKSWTQLRD